MGSTSFGSFLILAGVLALFAARPVAANSCPRYVCPTTKTDNLDALTSLPPIYAVNTTLITNINQTDLCKAMCPCRARYFALRRFGSPTKYECNCYKTCVPGTFTGAKGSGAPAIKHGYICENVCDDPHFVGAHGTRYDFNGELDKSFCLITDKGMHLNAFFKGYYTDTTVGATVLDDGKAIRTWMSELGLIWTDAANMKHTMRLVAAKHADLDRGSGYLESVSMDGATVALPHSSGEVVRVADMTLTFIGTHPNAWGAAEDKYIVSVGEKLQMMLHLGPARPVFHLPGDAMVHFSFSINKINPTKSIHGVLGQTFRNTQERLLRAEKYSALDQLLHESIKADGVSGKGFLDGTVEDYISSDVTVADCAVSAF